MKFKDLIGFIKRFMYWADGQELQEATQNERLTGSRELEQGSYPRQRSELVTAGSRAGVYQADHLTSGDSDS